MYDESWENEGIDEVIDDKFPMFAPLTHAWTTGPNFETLHEITCKEWFVARQWGVECLIIETVQDKEGWFMLLHPDGTKGYYHFLEFRTWPVDDDEGGGESPSAPEDGSGPATYFVTPQLPKQKSVSIQQYAHQ